MFNQNYDNVITATITKQVRQITATVTQGKIVNVTISNQPKVINATINKVVTSSVSTTATLDGGIIF